MPDDTSLFRSINARLEYESLFGTESLPSSSAQQPVHEAPSDSLESIAAEVRSCTDCHLCETRTHAVPGDGAPDADIVFIGEAPGRDEDQQGNPFVGRAGKLLDKMMAAIDLDRTRNAFIANILKCRPPNNRTPTPQEMITCIPYLKRQLAIIQPRVICALGGTSSAGMIGEPVRITQIRGRTMNVDGYLLIPTFHPAYLLRNPAAKKEAWEDLKLIRRILDGDNQ